MGSNDNTTVATKVDVGVQRITACKGTKNKPAPNADAKEVNKFGTFRYFGTRLPREIVAMIIEEAVSFGPAIAYADCNRSSHNSLRLYLNNGRYSMASKYREVFRLAKVLPDFRTIIERRFGLPLDEDVSRNPILGVRKDKDLVVFNFDHYSGRGIQFFNWVLSALYNMNRVALAPGVRNVGVRFNIGSCRGTAICYGCASCVRSITKKNSCAWELASFCQNLSRADDVFMLVLLKGSDVISTNIRRHANLMKTLIADSRTIPRLVSFEDVDRTWVEVSRRSPRTSLALINVDVLAPIVELCRAARSINSHSLSRIIGSADARPRVRFRILVASRWKNATLKI
ncbi:hypothetical protein LX36DRAFT_637401 [Colletotrichum falcatum]|nr:hypothetical protein LX36DRAFT_637401 [Colletotrichum falcatum]